MPTEVADFVGELDQSRPQGSESVGESDDHDRLIKKCLTQTFLGDGASDLWDTALNVGPRYLNDLPNTYTPDNWVTLDTEQTITGAKTFEAVIRADLGLNNANDANLISEAADVTAISNYADDTVVLGTDADTLTVAWNAGVDTATVLNTANFIAQVIGVIYPVGSVLHTSTATNPGDSFTGTTWAPIGEGRYIASVGNHTDANGDLVAIPNGDVVAGTYNHTLTESELPAHTHDVPTNQSSTGGQLRITQTGSSNNADVPTSSVGGDGAHNNMPPGYGLYVWERTA